MRLDLYHELLIGLVCTVNPQASGLYHHPYTVPGLERSDGLNRSSEIRNVKASAQTLRQRGLEEFHHHGLSLHPNIDTHLIVGKRHDDTSCSIGTSAKIQVLQRLGIAAPILGKPGSGRRRRRGAGSRIQHHQQRFALQLRLISGGLFEVQNHPGTVPCLHHADRFQIALIDLHRRTAHAIRYTREIQRNARRRLNRETARHRC